MNPSREHFFCTPNPTNVDESRYFHFDVIMKSGDIYCKIGKVVFDKESGTIVYPTLIKSFGQYEKQQIKGTLSGALSNIGVSHEIIQDAINRI